MAFTYIAQCADGSYYTGWTTDLEKRIAAHNEGRGARYTRSRRPIRLAYWEEHRDRRDAMRREAVIRRFSHDVKKEICEEFQHILKTKEGKA